jgi:hypothetical protein
LVSTCPARQTIPGYACFGPKVGQLTTFNCGDTKKFTVPVFTAYK